jgi:branched-chain amino acid transport system substrate-binding protein
VRLGVSRIYASLPVSGPQAQLGRDLLRGAELALERFGGAELVVLDSCADDRESRAVDNAERAVADRDAIAYLGDLNSSQIMHTAPILGAAGLLSVAPLATFAGLRGPTLVRLTLHDGAVARSVPDWLVGEGVGELLVVHDHDDGYGVPVGAMCVAAARDRGLAVRSRPVWNDGEPPAQDLGEADALLYVGVAGSDAPGLWRELRAAAPGLWLLGLEGLADHAFAAGLDEASAERTLLFVGYRTSTGFYGFEAMALILDALASAGPDRAAVVRAVRATRDRDSVLGRYSIDADGHISGVGCGRLAVIGGRLAWD